MRALDVVYPYLFASHPLEMYTDQIASSAIVDVSEEYNILGSFPQNIPPSKTPEIAIIDGKYYILSKGEQYYGDYLTCKNNDLIFVKIHRYPSDIILRENLENLHGITVDELAIRDQMIQESYDNLVSTLKSLPTPTDPTNTVSEDIRMGKSVVSQPEMFITQYIANYEQDGATKYPKIPVLCGGSGIAKSAIVDAVIKKVSSKWGFRLVTLKTGFIDKSDLLGYVSVVEVLINGANKRIAQDSPMKELLTATDAFVDSCRELVTYAESRDTNSLPADYDGEDDEKVLAIAREYAKTPVIFWDELNRTDPLIIPQIMVIVNDKRLNNYLFRKSPMIAAVNINVSGNADLDDMYKILKIEDLAAVDRFMALDMDPKDPSLLGSFQEVMMNKWGAKLPNLQEIMSRLNSAKVNNIGLLYNDSLYKNADIGGPNADLTFELKFPTFRGWDMVFQYLDSCINAAIPKPISIPYIKSIIGVEGGDRMEDTLAYGKVFKDKYTIAQTKDINLHQHILDESFDCGLPCLLTGRFGLAKTAKIKALAARVHGEVIMCDLSAQDKVTVRGMPEKRNLSQSMFGASTGDLYEHFSQISGNNPLFPQYTTESVPFDFYAKVLQCEREDRPLILVFDELNRCAPVVMSSVFDAISEKKFLGVDLTRLYDKGLVRIVAAANVGEGYDVDEVDAAIMARFSSARKDKMDLSDIDSFLTWGCSSLSPIMYQALQSTPKTDLLSLFDNDIDGMEINLNTNLSSFRSIQTLDSFINDNPGYLYAFSDNTPISDKVSNMYLGKLYGKGDTVSINGAKEISVSDALENLDKITDPDDRLELIRQYDDKYFNKIWRWGIFKVLPNNQLYTKLVRKIEIALFKRYNIYDVTPVTLGQSILNTCISLDCDNVRNKSLIRIIHDQLDQNILVDIENGAPMLTSSELRKLVTDAIINAKAGIMIDYNDADIDSIIGQYIGSNKHPELIDDAGLKPIYDTTVEILSSYDGDISVMSDVIKSLDFLYEVEYSKEYKPADSKVKVPIIGPLIGAISESSSVINYIMKNLDHKALYVLSSGDNLSVLHLIHFSCVKDPHMTNAPSDVTINYCKLRLKEDTVIGSSSLSFSSPSIWSARSASSNHMVILLGNDPIILEFDGISGTTQVIINAYALPLISSYTSLGKIENNIKNSLHRFNSGSQTTLGSVSGDSDKELLVVTAEIKVSDMANLTIDVVHRIPIMMSLQKWNGAMNTVFNLLKKSFKNK